MKAFLICLGFFFGEVSFFFVALFLFRVFVVFFFSTAANLQTDLQTAAVFKNNAANCSVGLAFSPTSSKHSPWIFKRLQSSMCQRLRAPAPLVAKSLTSARHDRCNRCEPSGIALHLPFDTAGIVLARTRLRDSRSQDLCAH